MGYPSPKIKRRIALSSCPTSKTPIFKTTTPTAKHTAQQNPLFLLGQRRVLPGRVTVLPIQPTVLPGPPTNPPGQPTVLPKQPTVLVGRPTILPGTNVWQHVACHADWPLVLGCSNGSMSLWWCEGMLSRVARLHAYHFPCG